MFLEAPEWLLTAPVAAVWAAWWWRRRATGLPAGTSGVSLALWVLAACAVAVAASGPRIREARPVPVEVVVLVDGSESMQGPALDRARRVAGEIAAAAPAEAASVRRGTFARGLAWDGVEATLDASSTDAGRAVSLAAALPSSGARRRIALVTDANDTSGAVRTAAAAARAAGVPVHVVAIGETAPELVVASLDVPRAVRRGRTFAAGVRVAGTRPGRLACSLAVGSAPPIERAADFAPPGATLRWGGLAVPAEAHDRLSVRVECRGGSGMDTWPQNNARQETVEITGAMRAWCLDLVAPPAPVPAPVPARAPAAATAPSRPGPGPQCATLARLLGDTADVVPVGPEEVRRLATATPRPDVLVLGNTGPGVLPPVAEPLAEAVRTGVGVLFLGGERALSLAGLGGTAIERDLLPVFLTRREEESVPERAVVMVLDRSSSMTGQKIALARESAIASARALPKETLLGVIAFDSQPYVILKPGPVGDASRAAAALAAITPSGGTDILKALRAARAMIEPVRAVQRVVVLLTDGASNPKDVVETAASMGREGVQVSTIAVGPEPDRQLLARVAEATGGRHYWARSAEAVPRLLLAEVTGGENAPAPDGKRSVVPASTPIARRVFRGVDPARLVPIDGLDHTQERPEGVAVAATETGEPIAAVRRVGAGQAAAFTPGLEDRWAGAFLAVPDGARVLVNLVNALVKQSGAVEVRPGIRVDEDRIEVTADVLGPDGDGLDGATVRARITGPDGTTREVALQPVGLGRHAASPANDFGVPGAVASRSGSYGLVLTGTGPGATPGAGAGSDKPPLPPASRHASLAYPAELARFGADRDLAARIAAAGGGRVDPPPAELFAGAGTAPFARPAEHLFLLPALALFVAGMWVRRVRL